MESKDTGTEEITYLLHVFPGGALQGLVPQQGRRVVGNHGRDSLHLVPLPAHAADGRLVAQEGLRRDLAERHEDAGADERDLLFEIAAAGGDLVRLRVAVAGRAALHDVGDVDL